MNLHEKLINHEEKLSVVGLGYVGLPAAIVCSEKVDFTSDEARLRNAKFHIVAVPTPVKSDHKPDLSPVEGASHLLGTNLIKDSIVVY